MDRVSSLNFQTIGGRRTWLDKNPAGGVPYGTTWASIWAAGVQESIIAVAEGVGIVPADSALGSVDTQLLQAIQTIASGHKTATITASAAVTAANAGLIPVDATAGNIVIGLPLSASANGQGFRYKFIRLDATTHTVSLALAGADTLLVVGGTSVALTSAAPVELIADGGTHYVSISPVSASNFPSSLGSSGWKKYPDPNSPSGYFIEQWGSGASTSFPQTVTLPIAMPNALLRVLANEASPSGGWTTGNPTLHAADSGSFTPSNFHMYSLVWTSPNWIGAGAGGLGYQYMAKGY